MRFGVIGNVKKPRTFEVLRTLESLLDDGEAVLDAGLADFFSSEKFEFVPIEQIADVSDAIIVIGGDGTFLKAARYAKGKPLTGINLGRVGFLTTFDEQDLPLIIKRFRNGEFDVERRMGVACERLVNNQKFWGLNEIVLVSTSAARILEIEVSSCGLVVARLRADGIMVASPTGSTAYNLAAGGPIIHPTMDALIVTPICAHTLTLRPFVLPPDCKVTITARSRGGKVLLSADGQDEEMIDNGEAVVFWAVRNAVSIAKFPESPEFFELLKAKFRWG